MKKFLSILSISILLFCNTSCLKDDQVCTPRSVQNEQATMTSFATTNGINAIVHSSGVNYEIIIYVIQNILTAQLTNQLTEELTG